MLREKRMEQPFLQSDIASIADRWPVIYLEECEEEEEFQVRHITPDWQNMLSKVLYEFRAEFPNISRIQALEMKIQSLDQRCRVLEQLRPVLAPIATLPEPYEVIKPLYVSIRIEEDQYIASFFDANLSESGDTREEAVLNLKEIIATTFEILITMDESELGPGPLQQRKVLEEYVRRKA